MTDTSHLKNGPIVAKLRESLHSDVDLGPARLELERRRLVATVAGAPLSSRRFRIGVAIGATAGLAAAAAALLVFVFAAPPEGEVPPPARIAGLVDLGASGPFADGRTARVPPSSGAKLVLADGTSLWLAADTAISSPDGGARRFRLESGRALAQVAPQRDPARFVVETAFGDVEVRGTVFSVRVAAAGLTIDLYEGSIRFVRDGTAVDLKPGESLCVHKNGSIASRGPIDRAAVLADLLITEKTAELPGAPVPRLAPPADVEAAPSAVEQLAQPSAPIEPAAPPPREQKRPPRRPPAAAPAPEPPAPVAEPAAPAALADPALAEIVVQPAPPADEKLFLDAYEKAVSGKPEDARALLEKYLASYPEGRYWQRVAEILGEAP